MTGDHGSDQRAAFEALYRETCRPLLAHLRRRAPGPEAEDLLAEVYLVAWRKRDQLPVGDEQRLWLYGVARRLLAAHHRAAAGPPAGARPADLRTPPPDGEPQREGARLQAAERSASERDEAVREALASLPEIDRELVTLTVWDGLSTASAARVLGLTPVTARVRLHRARARLARNPRLLSLLVGDAERDAERRASGGWTSVDVTSSPPRAVKALVVEQGDRPVADHRLVDLPEIHQHMHAPVIRGAEPSW